MCIDIIVYDILDLWWMRQGRSPWLFCRWLWTYYLYASKTHFPKTKPFGCSLSQTDAGGSLWVTVINCHCCQGYKGDLPHYRCRCRGCWTHLTNSCAEGTQFWRHRGTESQMGWQLEGIHRLCWHGPQTHQISLYFATISVFVKWRITRWWTAFQYQYIPQCSKSCKSLV